MPLVVMLTSLAGPDIDILPGDRADCKHSTAIHLVAVGYARELCLKGSDDNRPLKWLDNPATKPGADPQPEVKQTLAEMKQTPAEMKQTPPEPTQKPTITTRKPPSKTRKPTQKASTDANQDAPQSAQA